MSDLPRLWMRHETRQTERRAPIVPDDARRLVEAGVELTVEESTQRIFPTDEYAAAGCRIAAAGDWLTASPERVIVGLKELPELPAALPHRHVYFGHVYKNQEGARRLLGRFAAGGGVLLDIEFLVENGRRVASFGHWAGYVGAALSVLRFRDRLPVPLHPYAKDDLDASLAPRSGEPVPRVLVIGAEGRCGRGARAALATAGIEPTCLDVAETRELDRGALLDHDILVNTVLAHEPIPPFLTHDDLDTGGRRLSLICDVTCDVTSECNALPIYERATSWPQPVVRLRGGDRPLDIIAIDNLPSLLPRQASVAFSAELFPQLLSIEQGAAVWRDCAVTFKAACREAGIEGRYVDV